MALARFNFTVQDRFGNAIPGATISVREEVDGLPLAPIYEDDDGETPINNGAFTSDENGFVTFTVVGGFYRIKAVLGEEEWEWEDVGIGTTQGFDVGQLLALAATGALNVRGAWLEADTYTLYDLVTHQGSSWIYTAAEPSSGNAPPTLPDVANEYWMLVAGKGETGEGISYDAVGVFAERDSYADEEEGFKFLSLDGDPSQSPAITTAVIFILETAGSPFEWSEPIPVQGPQGPQGATPAYQFGFSLVTTDGDPGAGVWRANNADFALADMLFISRTAGSGADISAWLDDLEPGDELHFTSLLNPAIESRWRVTAPGSPADSPPDAYAKLPVELISTVGVHAAGLTFALGVDFIGPEGVVDTADFLQPGTTNDMTVGYTHTVYDHGTKGSGAQSVQPQPALGQKQKVAMAAGCNLTVTPPSQTGDVVLRINNSGVTAGLILTGFSKIFLGDAYSTASGKKFNLYVERLDGLTTCLLRAVN